MRRSDREITNHDKIKEIIESCECCRLGFQDKDGVYLVPLNFAFEETDGVRVFYFHGSREGKKMELARTSPRVGFELDIGYGVKQGVAACGYSFRYSSVIGKGTVTMVDDLREKEKAMRMIMKHYTGREDWTFTEGGLKGTGFLKLVVTELTCKEAK
jgi:nitroimidazol reductase NimA-like FMN-containing flavoprotein (pyridoxamine 5'-phosphate oxidase superfamily)